MKRLIQRNVKSMFFIFLSLLIATMIVNSSYALIEREPNYTKEDGRNHNYHRDKSSEGNQLFGVASLKVEYNTGLKSHTYSDQSLVGDNQSGLDNFTFSSWYDPLLSCSTNFDCVHNFTTGWKDKTSIQFSTNNTNDNTSKIVGQEVDVEPNGRYQLLIHMKQNQWVVQSRAGLEGFNETSKQWYHIDQCPSAGVNGPLEWQEFSCGLTIEGNTTKVRPLLDAGSSSEPQKEATTWFDSISLIKFKSFLTDPNLMTQLVYQGLEEPVSMAFLGPNDFLVTENDGSVHRIVNGVKLAKPVLHLAVVGDGLLGIAVSKNGDMTQTGKIDDRTYVFLYFGMNKKDPGKLTENAKGMANRLYRYELINNTLVNPKLLLDLPAGFNHNGGPILVAPDKQSVYLSVGDVENQTFQVLANKALNNKTGTEPDGTAGILHVTLNGNSVQHPVLGGTYPRILYYAYGIRQIFGIDFDPVTGKLWDTENGANWGDEINLVEPGFNSGWNKVQGIWKDHVRDNHFNANDITHHPSGLVSFGGKGKYRSPEFVWKYTVGPTALKFLNSDKLGKQYENDIFVGDVNNGRIYHFKLNQSRTGLLLEGPLMDKVADTDKELDKVVFAGDFGIITDIKVGPDGYLYFVVFNEGKIYKIVPRV
jgi:glucose/arabinose dehydrogenase